ncbi:TPA: ABC transporter ATP-binding protein [Staphylococcus pseudintermedius]|nr:ABC transporter ATP-binding protein [Staphylococcus pseudintermedius]EIM5221003.1 ABC transporter ATP-binding protein [Staphylococcus pseudintermedius]EKF8396666.1 ABC transporter ATP-binding protein [Staphylococcus pseudintermedius]EKO8574851.1 ABC transporter ATP-binding protein [Staphylococcus pseudintermedius]HAR6359027.1 ABC transporter ATP-binding protein [Staphylococcus pseudintermedius]
MMSIHLNNLCIWYEPENLIIKNANLYLQKGKIYGLLGKNGSGKTTLINTICGVIPSFSGDIIINNLNISKFNYQARLERFYVPDSPPVISQMTSKQYISFVLNMYQQSLSQEHLLRISKKYNFERYLDIRMNELSFGNKKKAALICSILLDVPIKIFDEPLNGLDIESIDLFVQDLFKMTKEDKCVILSSHLLDIVKKLTPNIIYINNKHCFQFTLNDESDIRKVLSDYDKE